MLMRGAAFTLFLITACAAASPAPDVAAGKALHDADCLVCHQPAHYTRADRKVNSLERLEKQVEVCQQDVGAEWDAQQSGEVVHYLNSIFYRF